jgi:hypothetical protein
VISARRLFSIFILLLSSLTDQVFQLHSECGRGGGKVPLYEK